jgi:hypothetical protein
MSAGRTEPRPAAPAPEALERPLPDAPERSLGDAAPAPPAAPSDSATAGRTDVDGAGRTDPGEFEAVEALPSVLRVVGSVVAQTTLLTALMFYFGLLYAVAYYRYFGVNYSVLDLSVQDLLILSADAAIPPLTYLAAATLRLPLHTLSQRRRMIIGSWLAPVLAAIGAALVSMAVADAYLGLAVFPAGFWEARGLSLTVGVLVIAYAGRLRRVHPARTTPRPALDALLIAKWASVFVLVAVGLFWAVGSYAIGTGTGNAQGFTAGIACAPEVVLYSDKSLDLRAAGLLEEVHARPEAADTFRYSGLRLVPQPGDELLLLPADWARGGRPALLLPQSDGLRLEFLLTQC